ncbi:MAG: formylglycine-generating enzyme family protein [Kiritimatiellae bacterium]|nr:formylglycine-generating enzyme family protein [Kiritimatiellia bacterium]
MMWNMAADMPENYNRAKFSMKIYAYADAAPYMVIDLSAGPDAEKYEVSYLTEIPSGEWDSEYKTTKLVLKLVTPGTFMMGSPVDELGHNCEYSIEPLHKVTLTQPFYMGVFEVTQSQYQLVMGANPSSNKGNDRPVESVSYNVLRGSTLGAQWPSYKQVDASSFFGKIRARTGITFDLPTEAQWEYTCRAGSGTALNSGKNLTTLTTSCPNLSEVGRYRDNTRDGKGGYSGAHTVVGKYAPNAWGFYDMHGNVSEWCRDWWRSSFLETETDPSGSESGTYRVLRGGDCDSYAQGCRSAYRNQYTGYNGYKGSYPARYYSSWGFRIAAYPAE